MNSDIVQLEEISKKLVDDELLFYFNKQEETKKKAKKKLSLPKITLTFQKYRISVDASLPELKKVNRMPELPEIRIEVRKEEPKIDESLRITAPVKKESPLPQVRVFLTPFSLPVDSSLPEFSHEERFAQISNVRVEIKGKTSIEIDSSLPSFGGGGMGEEIPPARDNPISGEPGISGDGENLIIVVPGKEEPYLEVAYAIARVWARVYFGENPDVISAEEKDHQFRAEMNRIVNIENEEKIEIEKLLIGKPKVIITRSAISHPRATLVRLSEDISKNYMLIGFYSRNPPISPLSAGIASARKIANTLGVFVKPQSSEEEIVDKDQFLWKCVTTYCLLREMGINPQSPEAVLKAITDGRINFEERIGNAVADITVRMNEDKIAVEVETFYGSFWPLVKIAEDVRKYEGNYDLKELWIVIPPIQSSFLRKKIRASEKWFKKLVESCKVPVKILSLAWDGGDEEWKLREILSLEKQ